MKILTGALLCAVAVLGREVYLRVQWYDAMVNALSGNTRP